MLKESACRDHFKRHMITAEEYRKKAAYFDAFLQQQRAVITGNAEAPDKPSRRTNMTHEIIGTNCPVSG